MNNKTIAWFGGLLLAVLFFALVFLNNQFLDGVRLDLTENQVYSLSSGSEQILNEIDEPINLYFFFSDDASKGMTSLRNYANRVESLLQEYSKAADGKIRLHLIDPEPFSEAEDQATEFGLTAATIGPAGDAIYLGLAGTNALDDQLTIGFFDPQKESFLEYEVSKLIYQLTDPEPVRVTLLTDLSLSGGQNPMTGRFDPPMTFFTQLQQLYEVQQIGSDAAELPQETDVLILVHPQNLSESLLYDIDQYAMQGGRVLAFVDPHYESDQMAMMGGMGPNASDLGNLLSGWGVDLDLSNIVLDAQAGLDIRTQAGGVTRHFGFLGLAAEQLDRDDVTSASLEIINGASFGHLSKQADSVVEFTPLIVSTENTDMMDASAYAMMRDPEELSRSYQNSNTVYTLAARLSGGANSAFESAPGELAEGVEHIQQTGELNVIVVADVDMLADRFWVQQANFFGQTIFTPFANNGDFFTNAVENLGGNNALISVRSRGTFARPFTVVQQLEVAAEQAFREQEQVLQQQLSDTEAQLAQLQGQPGEGGALVLSDEQQAAIDAFIQKRIDIRKELREVRYQLDKDIDALGNLIKFINIAAAPIILVLLLMGLARLTRLRAGNMGENKA
ncbi:GldG family protein [Aestuariibacter salexigens]|uniref:GldG family protein n=1 Tax=Aestuariibacter salexigens TaxID=226010 RepID=UPI000417CE85|nr:Gldg family protein [Aestuariibacter salexigens]